MIEREAVAIGGGGETDIRSGRDIPAIVSVPGGRRGHDPETVPELATRFQQVRGFTEHLASRLVPEDMVVQSMPDVSPTKWHLAHTSWFFEQFLLVPHLSGYSPLNETYLYLFNSYYHQAGERHCRDQRGYISRPTVAEVSEYRRVVDQAMLDLIAGLDEERLALIGPLIVLGLHHEQQHQELLLTDIKHVFSVNPLRPAYVEAQQLGGDMGRGRPISWAAFEGGVHEIGHPGPGFSYDNELPRHREYLEPFEIADRLVTNGEYLEFMEDGGYRRPELWLSMGWATVQERDWSEPFYWERREGRWQIFTLMGLRDIDPYEPVSHLTYFEADAYARWAGARLPTEAEWEVAASTLPIAGNFVESGLYHPAPAGPQPQPAGSGDNNISGPNAVGASATGSTRLDQFYGDLWEWTASQYTAYPGFRPAPGAVGEYNGKFMCNQFVLRGGSCATSADHIRPTYRNFFPPDASWQFSGVRLARDLG